jgi:hypothetical protein
VLLWRCLPFFDWLLPLPLVVLLAPVPPLPVAVDEPVCAYAVVAKALTISRVMSLRFMVVSLSDEPFRGSTKK